MDIWTRLATRPERVTARHIVRQGRTIVEAVRTDATVGGKLPHAELTRLRVIEAIAKGR